VRRRCCSRSTLRLRRRYTGEPLGHGGDRGVGPPSPAPSSASTVAVWICIEPGGGGSPGRPGLYRENIDVSCHGGSYGEQAAAHNLGSKSRGGRWGAREN
jgi:hypothetical protein